MKKKGAFELSIGTVVVIVIAMALLIMGLVLVRNIFTGATESVDSLDQHVQDEIAGLFVTDEADLVIKLGETNTAKIKVKDELFGIAIGARTLDGSAAGGRIRLKYKLALQKPNGNNCASLLGEKATENLFITPLNVDNQFLEFAGANVFDIIEINVPKGTAACSQKVEIDIKDTEGDGSYYTGSGFTIEIAKSGLF